jgi:cysteine desulfurase/selenocysteine lyase
MQYMLYEHSNVHRGVYRLSENATRAFEEARELCAEFLGGVDKRGVIFTSGTTDSLNLVAQTWGRTHLKAGDEILLPISEHHSNIVPWHMVAEERGAKVRFIPMTTHLRLDMAQAKAMMSEKTKVVAFGHVSNALGVIHPVKELAHLARQVGALVVVDGAQAAPHQLCDVKELAPDFYAISGHKMCGPTGIGLLFGKPELLQKLPPYKGGGEMIRTVTEAGSTWADIPHKYEAGTPYIAGAIGLGEAVKFLRSFDAVAASLHEQELGRYAYEELSKNKNIRLFVPPGDDWVGIVSFQHSYIHPHDLAAVMDAHSVCVRAGHHCTQPLMRSLGVAATTRLSPYFYNTTKDIDAFLAAIRKAESIF